MSGEPPNLIAFMLTGWRPNSQRTPKRIRNADSHRNRREQLSQRFRGDVLIIPTGHRKIRSNDTYYPFRPGTDFYYLTGAIEPDCVLVLLPHGQSHEHLLFVEPGSGKADIAFFTDSDKGELWDGPRLDLVGNRTRYSIACRPLSELPTVLRSISRFRLLRGLSPALESATTSRKGLQTKRDEELAEALSELRLVKDAGEVRRLKNAVAATKRGFEQVIARMRTAKNERELESAFWSSARAEGNNVGYPPVVASGAHACTLHWNRNDGVLRQGDLLLLDAGVETDSLYTADITRTLPLSGKFSRDQRTVYEIVLEAHAAALKKVKPGNDFMAPAVAARNALAHGLVRLGILRVPAEEALLDENQFYRRYTLHSVSHMLGLDVHDCSRAPDARYKQGRLLPGMVLTIEPGLYFQMDDMTVPPRYRGIGVRIEDDVLVTAAGHRVLSAGIPREAEEVEGWIDEIWRQ